MLWQCPGPQGLAVGHGCSCVAQSSVFLQKTAQKFKPSRFSLFHVLAVQLSCLEGDVHHVPFIIPGKRLFTRIHIPGFHITALLKTSQAGGTQSLGRMRTLSSHLPGSCNLYKFSSSVGCRLNIKPLKTFPASEHHCKGRAGADWGVPLLCVQGNTDPAAASRLRLPEGQTTAEVMRRFRPKASAWSVFVLVCGTRACPSTSFGQPWTLFFANSSQDSPGAGTGSDPENRQEQTFVPTSQRSSTLPS